MSETRGLYVHIQGIVQGVGFRPFVYSLASRYGLKGWVRNTTRGVEIEVDGDPEQFSSFLEALSEDAPPLAKIDSIHSDRKPPNGFTEFKIIHSQTKQGGFQPISPDVSICDECLKELFTPSDHRYRYPFINCTNCGPRFTIIKDIPYDRPQTTMAPFDMCDGCAQEYSDPLDRRFHAQPVACPECGPQIWLTLAASAGDPTIDHAELTGDPSMLETVNLLSDGKIIVIKGLGGFHLACDAANHQAVERLRDRKNRPTKPLAVMMPDLDTVARYCHLDDRERELLQSPQRPITLLQKRENFDLSGALSPGQTTLGVMLPYTPLHYLLFSNGERFPHAPYDALVMTSGNRRNQPIVTSNENAFEELAPIADGYLFHNRDIHVHCDDSVSRISDGHPYPIRRSRGYAPYPVKVPQSGPSILATGAELKNTFCFLKEDQAFLSQHIGDLENYQTLESFQQSLVHFEGLFRVKTEALAYDLHPDYLASRYGQKQAEKEGIPAIGVQHHFAHIAACLAEHGYPGQEPVIGCAFDGTGYGDDGHIWGGEILVADYTGYHRAYHLAYAPLPGGEKAIKEPWRYALAWLYQLGIDWEPSLPPARYTRQKKNRESYDPLPILLNQLETGTHTPQTSSMGRLFDAISSLIGVRQTTDYEAQAAIELEAIAESGVDTSYSLHFKDNLIDPAPLFREIVDDIRANVPAGAISARFHNGLADMILSACTQLRKKYNLTKVALSGGVWQNTRLLEMASSLLRNEGFTVFTHRLVPPNDGGLSLGQAVVAQQYLVTKGETNDVPRRARKDH